MAESPPPAGAAGISGSGPPSSRARAARSFLFWAAFALLVAAAAWVRLDSIKQLGISRGDGFKYVEAARKWAAGDRTIRLGEGDGAPYFRPAIYFLDSLAIRVLGENDSAIKTLHASMDIANVLLAAWAAWLMGRKRRLALVAAGLYAFIPSVVSHSRSEFVHVPSATFVLLAIAALLRSEEPGARRALRWGLLALSGFSLGAAANIHPDLALLGPVLVAFIFLEARAERPWGAFLRRAVPRAAVFTAFFFSLYALAFLTFGAEEVTSAIADEAARHVSDSGPAAATGAPDAPAASLLAPALRFGANVTQTFRHSFDWAFGDAALPSAIFIASLALLAGALLFARRPNARLAYPLMLLFGYAALYSFYSGAFYPSRARLILPLLPMLACHLAFAFDAALSRITPRYAPFALAGLAALFGFHIGRDYFSKPAADRALSLFPYRRLYDPLKEAVGPDSKLLIAPRALYSKDLGYSSDFYFGPNAVYATDAAYEPPGLAAFLKEQKIEYLFLAQWGYDFRKFRGADPAPAEPGEEAQGAILTERENELAALMQEWRTIYEYAAARRGTVAALTAYGPVFRVPAESPELERVIVSSAGDDFESGELDPASELAAVASIDGAFAAAGKGSLRIEPRRRWFLRAALTDFAPLGEGGMIAAEATTRLEDNEKFSRAPLLIVFYGPDNPDGPPRPLGAAGPINWSTAHAGWPGAWLRESRAFPRFEWPPNAERARLEIFVEPALKENPPSIFVDDARLEVLRWGPGLAAGAAAPSGGDE